MHFALTNVADECYTYRATVPAPGPESTGGGDLSMGATAAAIPAPAPEVVDTPPPPPSPPPSPSPESSPDDPTPGNPDPHRWRRETKEYTEKVTISYSDVIQSSSYPYLLVNIGSGVSILKVKSTNDYERVSGSSMGGGTYWGLCRLLTNAATFEEVLDIAEKGDASEIDMLVKDIYGGGYSQQALKGSMVASSFGKLVMKEAPRDGLKQVRQRSIGTGKTEKTECTTTFSNNLPFSCPSVSLSILPFSHSPYPGGHCHRAAHDDHEQHRTG